MTEPLTYTGPLPAPRPHTESQIKRFLAKIKAEDMGYQTPCWTWTAAQDQLGYGRFWAFGKHMMAHRAAYEMLRHPIPDGMTIDHLCRNPSCVNPDHLEVVSQAENVLRGDAPAAHNARKTHCKNGHPFEGDNLIDTGSSRACRICYNAYMKAYLREKRAKERAERLVRPKPLPFTRRFARPRQQV